MPYAVLVYACMSPSPVEAAQTRLHLLVRGRGACALSFLDHRRPIACRNFDLETLEEGEMETDVHACAEMVEDTKEWCRWTDTDPKVRGPASLRMCLKRRGFECLQPLRTLLETQDSRTEHTESHAHEVRRRTSGLPPTCARTSSPAFSLALSAIRDLSERTSHKPNPI